MSDRRETNEPLPNKYLTDLEPHVQWQPATLWNALFLPTLAPDPAQILPGQCCVWFEPQEQFVPVLFMGRTPAGQLVAGSLPLCNVNEEEAQAAFDSGAPTWLRRPDGGR